MAEGAGVRCQPCSDLALTDRGKIGRADGDGRYISVQMRGKEDDVSDEHTKAEKNTTRRWINRKTTRTATRRAGEPNAAKPCCKSGTIPWIWCTALSEPACSVGFASEIKSQKMRKTEKNLHSVVKTFHSALYAVVHCGHGVRWVGR